MEQSLYPTYFEDQKAQRKQVSLELRHGSLRANNLNHSFYEDFSDKDNNIIDQVHMETHPLLKNC